MNKVTKVFLDSNSFLTNGTLISKYFNNFEKINLRCGTSMVACIANYYKVPVIVFCESYKLSSRS
jgi:translation initiation factor 2B subunit (eIF-2B alpha/beta/delta family)